MSNVTNEEAEGAYQVLVVEDEFLIADELRRVLISGGFRVMGPVSCNEDALDLIDQDKPDFAVLDVYLGAETVTPVALELQRLKVPFVLASASSPHELASSPVLADAINLGKPTGSGQLIATVRKLIE